MISPEVSESKNNKSCDLKLMILMMYSMYQNTFKSYDLCKLKLKSGKNQH